MIRYPASVGFLVEADQQGGADPQGRGLEVARRPQDQGRERVVVGRVPQVEYLHGLAPSDDEALGRLHQLEGLVAALLDLAGIDDFGRLVIALPEELLGLLAAGSALAVVHPVDLLRHAPLLPVWATCSVEIAGLIVVIRSTM
jgi:hypothetical protein